MGYTHYWYRKPQLDKTQFALFAKDCKRIFDYAMNDMQIALDGCGRFKNGKPRATKNLVWFNGSELQEPGVWTTSEQISLPWPSSTASITDPKEMAWDNKTAGNWHAGDLVEQRVAPINNLTGKGSGSYETFGIEVEEKQSEWRKDEEMIFNCCKTAYRPYDLVVTAVLIALKHYFPGDEVAVKSDGHEKDWLDGKFLCQRLFNYGMDFYIDEPAEIEA